MSSLSAVLLKHLDYCIIKQTPKKGIKDYNHITDFSIPYYSFQINLLKL